MASRELTVKASDFYRRVASAYDSTAHERFYREIARALLDKIPPEAEIASLLEVGAGTGFGTLELARRFPAAAITALEPAPEMMSRGRQRLARADWVAGRLAELPPGRFDLVFASMSYQWLNQAERWRLRGFAQGGLLALALPVTLSQPFHNGNQTLLGLVRSFGGRRQWPRRLRRPAAALAELGQNFDRVEIFDGSVTERYPGFAELAFSLYARGALTALFGGAEDEARRQLAALSSREAIEFHWPIRLIVAGGARDEAG